MGRHPASAASDRQAAAIEMFFTGRRVTAAEALALGLIDSVEQEPIESAVQYMQNGRS